MTFTHPNRIITTRILSEVIPALADVESALQSGYYAAGFVTYEAAGAFDPALVTHPVGDTDLVWFGIFAEPCNTSAVVESRDISLSEWQPDTCAVEYCAMVSDIREAIARGETYQVNYTTRLRSHFCGSPAAFYKQVATACGARYCALLETGSQTITSFSPELFFYLRDNKIVVRPMKGTTSRGRTPREDTTRAEMLRNSTKERAENVMIVDLMRNDLGRVCLPGTIHVTKLFTPERYTTLWQLTSEVQGTLKPENHLKAVFKALFPCGSVTGAPKVRAMQTIAAMEKSPRGIYCGAIGFAAPNGDATFNVAIRTALFDNENRSAVFGSGGGITWGSSPRREYEEMLLKTQVVRAPLWKADPLESMRLQEGEIALLHLHLDRFRRATTFFGINVDQDHLHARLCAVIAKHPTGRWKLRLSVSRTGAITLEANAIAHLANQPWRAVISNQRVMSHDYRLYYKTTDRSMYGDLARLHPGYDEVLMQNERGELTEFLIGNLVIESAGRLFTPPISCGLLPGIMREHLVRAGKLQECIIYPHQLVSATGIWLINSVRGRVPIKVCLNTDSTT